MNLAETLYHHLPVAGQNLALSAWGIKYRRDRLGGAFHEEVRRFRSREKLSEEQHREYVTDELRRTLLHSFDTVPYYRDRWSAVGIEAGDLAKLRLEELRLLPPTPKEALRANPYSFRSRAAVRWRGVLTQHTSGSTGTPTTVFMTRENLRQFTAAREARSYGWSGTSISMRRATIGARRIMLSNERRPPFHRYNFIERQVYLSAIHISPANIAAYVQGLNRHRPEVFTGLAHSHYLLAHLMREGGFRLDYRPRAAIMGSETLTPQMRETIEEGLGARVFEEYGSVENCVLATECESGSLHVSPDFGILEIVDSTGQATEPGQLGRFLCTGLLNHIQPLVRFEIGDLGRWSSVGCICGRDHMPVLEEIAGRENDAIILADGRLVATGDEIFSGVAGVIEGQVVQQHYSSFTLRLVATDEFGEKQRRQLIAAMRQKVGEADVLVQVVHDIPRGPSGKFRPVLNQMAAPHPELQLAREVEGVRE